MPQATASGPTLTDISYVARQVVKFGSIFIIVFMVGRTFLSAFSAYWKATHPPPPPPPTVGFGLLPALQFPVQSAVDKPTSYQLETATGTLSEFGDRAKVLLMLHSIPSLLDDERAKNIAAGFDFLFAPQVLGGEEYRFTKSQPLESTFELNTRTLDFTLSTNFFSRPELLVNQEVPDQASAVQSVKSALSKVDLLPEDMATAAGETIYLKALGSELSPALSFSDADLVQVDLYRLPIDSSFRFYTPKGNEATIHAIISGSHGIVSMNYHYQKVDYTQIHTYPIRTAQSAWKLLQAGEGYIAQKGTEETAIIRKVDLGYYDAFEEQEYLQPIYVFEGDNGFLGYVPALDPTYITN